MGMTRPPSVSALRGAPAGAVLAAVAFLLPATTPATADVLTLIPDYYMLGAAGWALGTSVGPAGDFDGNGRAQEYIAGAPARFGTGAAFMVNGTAGWVFSPGQAGAATGATVAPAGDVNGDGFADLIVGSPLWNGAVGVDHGRVDVFFGGPGGLPPTPSQTFIGPVAGGQFATSIATAGDIDGNGFDDIVVGAPFTMEFFAEEGAVYVFEGGPAGLSGPTWIRHGGVAGANLGAAVSGAGDVDADGYGDIIVGAPGKSVGFVKDGAAFVYRGSATGLPAIPSVSLNGVSDSAQFGASVSLAGDVNGDGFADVLVGSPNRKFAGTPFGEVVLLAGAPGGLDVELWKGGGSNAREFYGSRVACVGDVNGDGYSDFAIAADRWPVPAQRRGRVEVFLGGAGPYKPDFADSGTVDGQAFGAGLGTSGDLDHDGFSELMVGSPGATQDEAGQGRVNFYRGSASFPVIASGWSVSLGELNASFGNALAGGVDYAGTGANALLVAAPYADIGFTDAGAIFTSLPAWPTTVFQGYVMYNGPKASAQIGMDMVRVGDVDGDRDEELLVGSPYFFNTIGDEGLAQLFLGGGGAHGLATPPAWSYEGGQIFRQTGRSVSSGDYNGDGYADLAVGSYGGGTTGDARVFHGGLGGPPPPASPSWTSPPVLGTTHFGSVLATGDWDADGYSDLAVSAWSEANGQTNEGRVRVWFGGPGGLGLQPAWSLELNIPNANFGYSIDDAGDVNGDGVADLVISAPGAGPAQVRVFFGNRARAVPQLIDSRRIMADAPGLESFGRFVAGIGDVDKDGFGDILVSHPQWYDGTSSVGKVWIFRGAPSTEQAKSWWSYQSDVADGYFGYPLERCGDLNDDGWPDFAIGASTDPPGGRAFVFLGGGQATFRKVGQRAILSALPIGGRVAANDFSMIHTLRSPAGRAKAAMCFQLGTQNEAFGQGLVITGGRLDTGAPAGGVGSALELAASSSALTPGIGYRFRTRNVPHSPYFPPTTWAQPRAFEDASVHFRVAGSVVDVPGLPGRSGAGALAFGAFTPSPFRDATRIAYVTPRAGRVALDVFDASGRHVRRLAAGPGAAGEQSVAFDGRSDDGVALAAGVYFLRLELDGAETVTKKLVRLP